MMSVIEVDGLTRRFGERVAVDDLSFAVERGEVFGFLGPNGAGKTTTIKMLTCQLQATAGTARLLNHDIRHAPDRIKPLIGVVFEEQNLYERMSGRDNLAFSAQLYAVSSKRVEEVLALVGLSGRGKDRVGQYSNGMRQRLIMARALLHSPQILFLDEPTRGLDPAAAQELRAIITELSKQGVTVFLTTHDMDDADRLCDRVAIIDRGRIVALDSPLALRLAHGQHTVKVLLKGGAWDTLSLDIAADKKRLIGLIEEDRALAMHSQEATLEDAFVALTGRRLVE